MAQSIVLKRSALSGKVPGTSSLSLGEVAINTYDGRVFFKKSGSIESVEHILTTNSVTTGSITLTKTGSFGEIVVSQDGNFQRDIFVTRDIVGNGDLDVLGSLTASLSNGYVWVGNGSNRTVLVATSSFGTIINLTPLNEFTASQTSKNLTLASYTGSIDSKFSTIASVTGNLQIETSNLETFSSSALIRLSNLESTSASLLIETSNLELFTASQNTKNSTIASYTSSIDTKFATLQNITSSLISNTGSYATTGSNNFIGNQRITGSLNISGSVSEVVSTHTISTPFTSGNYPLSLYDGVYTFNFGYYASTVGTNRLSIYRNASQTYFDNSSGNFYFNSPLIATSLSGQILATNGIVSGSSQVLDILTSLNSKTGSYATTGSNIFNGNQIISGSTTITGDLTILGSSSFQTISSSLVKIGDNQIILNTFTPTIRFGGISVIDSGSSTETGSLWWDSQRNHWLYEHPSSSAAPYNSAILISGPYNNGALGDEVGLTSNRLTLAIGEDHISSSQIYVDNTTVAIPSNLQVTGSFDLRNTKFNATASNSSAGNVLVSQNQTGSYISAFYNYAISSGSNMRAGQIMSIWSGSVIRYTEVTTTDIGSTANVNFSASINAGNVLLHLSSSGVWNVRSIVNLL